MLSKIPDRYTEQIIVVQYKTRVNWTLIARDAHQAIADRIVSPIQKRLNRMAVCVCAAVIAAAVGLNAAIDVYRQLSN